ncbi:MAG: truA [Firmicutes bacterium]|nr:truA [Bacillota bacterium]
MAQKTRNIKLTISYDGTAYHGFQWQANAVSVQNVLEDRLALIFGHSIRVVGSARTDTGVHSYGQVVNLVTSGSIPTERIPLAAKKVLPKDIVVCKAEDVPDKFHARFDAKSKIYLYRINDSGNPDPWLRNYVWQMNHSLDVDAMDEAVQMVVGTHDFSAFRSAGSSARDPVRTILSAACRRNGRAIECEFHGTGFLYHMVRNLVGTLVEIGMAHRQVSEMQNILMRKRREDAGHIAPPQGLYLVKVLYD